MTIIASLSGYFEDGSSSRDTQIRDKEDRLLDDDYKLLLKIHLRCTCVAVALSSEGDTAN